ncbi:hypothetical protein PAXRUDRAFT_22066, partial [Paxillus rubicundulus Ve08.2h10]
EADKTALAEKKAADSHALKIARAQGKEVLAAKKAQIAQEKVTAVELKKAKKFRLNAAKQTEKERITAEKKALKAQAAEQKQDLA